jgi:hypothetical protein
MQYRRLHIRVPASGGVILSVGEQVQIEASVINVSAGGISIAAPSHLLDEVEYHVEVFTPSHGRLKFSGVPVYQTMDSVGIKITAIDHKSLQRIYLLVENFQFAEGCCNSLEDQDMPPQNWFSGDTRYELAITFET